MCKHKKRDHTYKSASKNVTHPILITPLFKPTKTECLTIGKDDFIDTMGHDLATIIHDNIIESAMKQDPCLKELT